MSNANLEDADLWTANLNEADLSGAYLTSAVLQGATLSYANLSNASMQAVDLTEANLTEANLQAVDMTEAKANRFEQGEGMPPHAAYLFGAALSKVNLAGANLSGVQVDNRLLMDLARSLEGAIMPDGQKYEDWLGTREGQDCLRQYKKYLGADKKRAGEYEDWIKTPEGKMWLKAVGEDGENSGRRNDADRTS